MNEFGSLEPIYAYEQRLAHFLTRNLFLGCFFNSRADEYAVSFAICTLNERERGYKRNYHGTQVCSTSQSFFHFLQVFMVSENERKE